MNVKRNAVKRNAVKRNAVKRNAVKRNAVKRNAVKRNAIKHKAIKPSRRLRSNFNDSKRLEIPRYKTEAYGRRAFSSCAPRL